jgi:hypothetical protein
VNLDRALDFLDFVEARHEVFMRRQAGEPQPWTDNPIVATRKFTNVFRVLDYGSQFVLTDLIEDGLDPVDQLMRLFLYRHTGRVEAWQYAELAVGEYATRDNLSETLEAFKEYRGVGKVKLKNIKPYGVRANRAGGHQETVYKRAVFTNAYLVFPQSQVPGTDKLESIFDLTERLFVQGNVGQRFLSADDQTERFETLRINKGVADFMSMQILTDWGYLTEFREDDFVIAGPGAKKGAAELGLAAPEAIKWAVDNIRARGVQIDGRLPSYMDAQNCLCEFSKYVRYLEKPIPATAYTPAHPGPLNVTLPRHW